MELKTKIIPLAGSLALILGVSLAGCSKQQGGMPQGGPAEVGVVTLAPQSVVITSELSGRTTASVVAEIRPQVSGILLQRRFREGSDVKAGDVLYQIDAASYQAAYESAKAALAKAEANVATARLKAGRYQELVGIKAVSQQATDEANAALKQAEAEVAGSKAAVEAARINLAYTRVEAPISGRIGKSALTQGALVTANQAVALATVQQLDPINVDITQSSTELLQMRRALNAGRLKRVAADQAKVKLLLEDGSAYPLEGQLAFSEATVDPGTGTVTLRAVFPNPKGELLPGMYVRAVLEQGMREQALLAPQQGVTRNAQGQAVAMVVNAEEKVEPRILKTERAIGDKWLVSEGLQAGDRLIVEGLQKARPGTPVKAVPAGSPAGAAPVPGASAAASAPAARQ